MCGIFGVATTGEADRAVVDLGMSALRHRGPDSTGIWESNGRPRVVLGSARLRILDLRVAADMPFASDDGAIALAYNGEVYNHREIRDRLSASGARFRTSSDTECVLRLYEHVDGDPEALLRGLEGMFAFALWDTRRGRLLLARDRLGIKPMVWCSTGDGIAFASEPVALVRAGVVPPRLDLASVDRYLRWGHVPGPGTIVAGVTAVPPGHYATWSGDRVDVTRWWAPRFDAFDSADDESLVRELHSVLDSAVQRQLVAERRVGVFLSGGVDSRSLATLAAGKNEVTALTVTFPDAPSLDESAAAARTAVALGLPHVEVPLVSSSAVVDVVDAVGSFAQPTVDALNSWFVCRAAAGAGLVVALSGLGGDELFSGYGFWETVPRVLRARRALEPLGAPGRRAVAKYAAALRPGSRVGRIAEADRDVRGAYGAVRSLFSRADVARFVGHLPLEPLCDGSEDLAANDEITCSEIEGYLADRLLQDTDAVSMAFSLEVRVPLLDEKVVDFALRVPALTRQRLGKSLLGDACGVVATSSKQGFELPVDEWLRGGLRDVARDALLSDDLPVSAYLDRDVRSDLWDSFVDGRAHWTRPWSVVVLQLWCDQVGLRA